MELSTLIADLTRPEAWPDPAPVTVIQTHISVVFLVGDSAWKLKKPVRNSFLDFSTRDLRRHFCEEEVRLNRRLAPSVYLGVQPIGDLEGRAVLGKGTPIDWVVQMRRLPESATLGERLAAGLTDEAEVVRIAQRIGAFHAAAERSAAIAAYGRLAVVGPNAMENLEQTRTHVGRTVPYDVHRRVWLATDAALGRLGETIEGRAARGVPCDTHGDLRLDHVYVFPDRPPPDDLLVLDGIEFNTRFRYADPVADAAFLAMDLAFVAREDLAAVFTDAWSRATGDLEGRQLFPFYRAYRAAVRAKVAGMKSFEPEVPAADRERARFEALAHWLFALGELEGPAQRPALVGVGGLPGTGKSTLAAGLAALGFEPPVRADVVRKELFGIAPGDRAGAAFGAGIYTTAATDRTYDECLARAEAALREGRRVVVDATFRAERHRQALLDLGRRLGVRVALLMCTAEPEVCRQRLASRSHDASDADWSVYTDTVARWETPAAHTLRRSAEVPTDEGRPQALDRARGALARFGMWTGPA